MEIIDCPGFGELDRDTETWGKEYRDALKKLTKPLCAVGFVVNSVNCRVNVTDCDWKLYMECLFKNLKSENIVFIFSHVDLMKPNPQAYIARLYKACGFNDNPNFKDMVSEEKTKRILFNKNDCSSARKDLINALKDTNKLSSMYIVHVQ